MKQRSSHPLKMSERSTVYIYMKEPDNHLFESLENIPDSLPKEIRARIMFVYNF